MTNSKVYSREDTRYRPVELDGLIFYQYEDNLQIIARHDEICTTKFTVVECDNSFESLRWHKVMICASSEKAGKIYVVLNMRRLRDIKVLAKILKDAKAKNLKTLVGKSFNGSAFRF